MMSKDEAVTKFRSLFYAKTGVKWENRHKCRYNPKMDIYFFPGQGTLETM